MYERTYRSRVLKTEPKQVVATRLFPWKRVLVSIGVLCIVSGIIFLIRLPQFQIRTVSVEGTVVADPGDVSQSVQMALEGTYVWILPKTSVFLLSTKTLENMVLRSFPRFKSVHITRSSMHELMVTTQEYPGVYLWCDDACSFMDEIGTVFADAPYFSGSAYVRIYVGSRSAYPFFPISPEQIQFVAHLKERLESISIVPLAIRFETLHTASVSFIHNGHQALLYIDPTADIESSLEALFSGLRNETVSQKYHNPDTVLEYLDVRFENKLIYKFR